MNQHSDIRPQNNRRPAGGTNSPDCGQRGVIVAPPSGNTDNALRVLHSGFDTLVLSIKKTMPPEMFAAFELARARAEEENQPVEIKYGDLPLMLRPHGGGGYRFNASGGRFGATWSFKKPNPKDPWGLRASFGSDFLAHLGLGGVISHLETAMRAFGLRYHDTDISIARVDYCVDILAPDFVLVPDQFVMHSATGRRDYMLEGEKAAHGRSGRVTSVTVGHVANRQAIVYDKREEVLKRGKVHWWHLWNAELKRQGLPPMRRKIRAESNVWRVELRAGKSLLKDRWNIRTFPDLYARFGDLLAESVRAIRYTVPSKTDDNRARWQNHPIWDIVTNLVETAEMDMRSFADPERTKEVNRDEQCSTILRNLAGLGITYAALKGTEFTQISAFLPKQMQEISAIYSANPEKYAKMLADAKARYRFK